MWCFPASIGIPKLSSYAKTEDKLFKNLFRNYQKWVRPVEYLNGTVRVRFGLAISQLVDVVRKIGILWDIVVCIFLMIILMFVNASWTFKANNLWWKKYPIVIFE